MNNALQKQKGFTLIELVIVIVLIGILAAVVTPTYRNITVHAEAAKVKNVLGNVRSAIAIHHGTWLASGKSGDEYPTSSQISSPRGGSGNLLEDPLPENPWAGADHNTPSSAIVAVATDYTLGAATNGWCYNVATGKFWANTSEDKTGGGEAVNEW